VKTEAMDGELEKGKIEEMNLEFVSLKTQKIELELEPWKN
jgi:hypothetical protein